MAVLKYILNKKGEPVAEKNLMVWGKWMGSPSRIVKQKMVGKVKVSTVFLGLNHRFSSKGPPILWETMVFGGKYDQYQRRCSGSREQALAMHKEVVAMVRLK